MFACPSVLLNACISSDTAGRICMTKIEDFYENLSSKCKSGQSRTKISDILNAL